MLRRTAVVLGTLALLAFALGRSPAAPVPTHLMPKDTPFSYPTTVGTTWVYDLGGREDTRTISKVEDKDGAKLVTTEHVLADGKRSHHMTLSVSAKGVFLVAEQGRTYETPWCIFKLPHKEGDTWKTEGHGGNMTAGPMEKVKVADGEVTAARVEWDVGDGRVASYWYAHGVGLVKMAGAASIRLKSFTPGKP